MDNYIYNIKNGMIFEFDSSLLEYNKDLVEINHEEMDKLQRGYSWDKIKAFRSNLVQQLISEKARIAEEKLAKEKEELDKSIEDSSVSIKIDKKTADIMRKEKEEAGEPDAFGDVKEIFTNTTSYNVTLEQLKDVKDEDLGRFGKTVFGTDYPEVPEGLDDSGKEMFYQSIRADIEKKIYDVDKKRSKNKPKVK